MSQASSAVTSSQREVHPRLEAVVRRHLKTPWREPLHAPTKSAFNRLGEAADFEAARGLILDSGCGTGTSTAQLAARHPDCLVIGVDRSASRLSRLRVQAFPHRKGNAIWLRAELASFWRLAVEAGWRLRRHYLLYPNPWPKPGQLKRRWHAHPVFPHVLALGGLLEMRCSWRVYAEEFALALAISLGGDARIQLESAENEEAWGEVSTPFGRKYAKSGHRLYRVTVDLEPFAAKCVRYLRDKTLAHLLIQ